jgi:hypothetical protein
MSPQTGASEPGGGAGRFYGKYRGKVTDNQDPNNLGRIKAKVPTVLGDEETGWALPSVPYAGPANQGQYIVPPVDAGVWIEFEEGDPSLPIWTGCFWASGTLPKDETGKDAVPELKILRTEQGLMAALDDGAQTIAISDSGGSNVVKIEAQNGNIRITAATKVIVEAPQIELVNGASHPLAFGDDLLNYLNQFVTTFNTHLHPGEMAAGMFPVTPMIPASPATPPTPSLLSTKVKTG